MKKLIIMKSFLRKNIFPILIIVVSLTVAMFVIITAMGKIKHKRYAMDIISKELLIKSIIICDFKQNATNF